MPARRRRRASFLSITSAEPAWSSRALLLDGRPLLEVLGDLRGAPRICRSRTPPSNRNRSRPSWRRAPSGAVRSARWRSAAVFAAAAYRQQAPELRRQQVLRGPASREGPGEIEERAAEVAEEIEALRRQLQRQRRGDRRSIRPSDVRRSGKTSRIVDSPRFARTRSKRPETSCPSVKSRLVPSWKSANPVVFRGMVMVLRKKPARS